MSAHEMKVLMIRWSSTRRNWHCSSDKDRTAKCTHSAMHGSKVFGMFSSGWFSMSPKPLSSFKWDYKQVGSCWRLCSTVPCYMVWKKRRVISLLYTAQLASFLKSVMWCPPWEICSICLVSLAASLLRLTRTPSQSQSPSQWLDFPNVALALQMLKADNAASI